MKVRVVESVLKANDAVAGENRRRMTEAGVFCVNLMSAPGSGKTALLEKTIPALAPQKCAVLVGDLQTTRDGERLSAVTEDTVQINTGRSCHLSATEVAEGLVTLDLEELDYLFIENVGNMVCPVGFDLGEHTRVALLSVPEGDDKVAKYPTLFQSARAILLTKVDLLVDMGGTLDFDVGRVKDDLSRINTSAPLIEYSSKTGQGLRLWLEWLECRRRPEGAAGGGREVQYPAPV
jgi:hydrogenase nickel incorporation protein HypB